MKMQKIKGKDKDYEKGKVSANLFGITFKYPSTSGRASCAPPGR